MPPAPIEIAPTCAIRVPLIVEFAPKTIAPSVTQNTLLAEAPLAKTTDVPAPVLNAAPILKIKTALGSFCASKINELTVEPAAVIE